ncbi:hypothetical protein QEN19_000475 [Hanseniaspora menglaensis]
MGIGNKKNSTPTQGYEFVNEFYPKNIKRTIHLITQQLKQESSLNIDYLFLPFRKEQSNEALLRFLNTIIPKGDGKPLENETKLIKIIKKTSPGVLFQSLKYIWSRTILPTVTNTNSDKTKKWMGIVGYDAYLKFKELEIEMMCPRKSFLEIMPRCLTSPDHASLVYDMFDLITTVSSNAPKNKMSCRKISKMCAIWAFDCTDDLQESNSFIGGIETWVPKAEAMFHLSLAFIRSFAPESEEINVNDFPVALLHVLKDNEYPPKQGSAKNALQVPVITLHRHYKEEYSHSNLKPWTLINNINSLFKVDDFMILENDSNQQDPLNKSQKLKLSRQQKALIKSIFSDKSSIETISKKMSKQSKKLMKEFTTKHSSFQAGWVVDSSIASLENGKYDYLSWTTCYVDDYYIWTWMSSLSNEESPKQRDIFGRSLILEFEFDAFKKWVVFEESSTVFQKRAEAHKKVVAPTVDATDLQLEKQQFVSKHVKEKPVVIKKMNTETSFALNDKSFANDSNVSSVYNNRTIINGYMTNGDITEQSNYDITHSSIDYETYKLPPVNVNESGFRIDLPDIDASHIIIDGNENNRENVLKNNESKDSITDVIKGLDDELKNVESQIGTQQKASLLKPADQFTASIDSTIKSLQFNGSQQQRAPQKPLPVATEISASAIATQQTDELVPRRSSERKKQSSSELLSKAEQDVRIQNQTSASYKQQQYLQAEQHQSLPHFTQQQFQKPLQTTQQQDQMPTQYSAQEQYQKSLQSTKQQYQNPAQFFVQQTDQRPIDLSGANQATSSTLYEQPLLNNTSSSQVTNGSISVSTSSTPVGSHPLQNTHVKKASVAAPIQQPVIMNQPVSNPVQMQVPQQVLQQKPKLPRAFTMQNLAQQRQQPVAFHNKQQSIGAIGVNQMSMASGSQRPQFQSIEGLPQKKMHQPMQGARQAYQKSASQRQPGLQKSQSYNQLPNNQKFTPQQQYMQQPRGTMINQQNPYARQQTMTNGYGQMPQQTMTNGYGQMPQQTMTNGYGQMPQQKMANGYGQMPQQKMANGYGQMPQQKMANGYGQIPQQSFMPQQFPVKNMRYGGNPGMPMPTSNKAKKQEKKNLQQQLRNGAFGM